MAVKVPNFINFYTLNILLISIFIGIYMKWPAPSLSTRLTEWKNNGKYFKFKDYYHIFYKDDIGQGSKSEVLVLIHGFPTSSYDWSKIHDGLKSKFGRVITMDMLGYGFSDKPIYHYVFKMDPVKIVEVEHNYTIAEQANIIRDLLLNLNITSVHLLTHDYGDTVGQELLYRYNNYDERKNNSTYIEIKTICMLNGGLFPDIHTQTFGQKLMLTPYIKTILPKVINYQMFSRGLSFAFGEKTKPSTEDLEDWWALLRYKDGQNALTRLINYIPERIQNLIRWTDALRNTKAKAHFIYGPEDPINPFPFEHRFRAVFQRATINVVHGCGHYVQHECPKQVLEYYFNFLKI